MSNSMNFFKVKAWDTVKKEMIPFGKIMPMAWIYDGSLEDMFENAKDEGIVFLPFSGLSIISGADLYHGDLIRIGDNGIWEVSFQDGMFKANQHLKTIPLVTMIENEKRNPEKNKITHVGNSYAIDKELYASIREDAYNIIGGNISKKDTVDILNNHLHEAITKFGDSPDTLQYLIDIAGYENRNVIQNDAIGVQFVDMDIVEMYCNLSSFSARENYLLHEVSPNHATLEFLYNDESDEEMAEFLSFLLDDKDDEGRILMEQELSVTKAKERNAERRAEGNSVTPKGTTSMKK